MRRLEGKVALITGAGSGIGRETALLLAREGARVAVADINADAAKQTSDLISRAGGEGVAIAADVTEARDCHAAVDATISRFGALHVLHNNAGFLQRSAFVDMSEELWARTIAINLTSVFLMTKAAVSALEASGPYSSVVNAASVLGLIGTGGSAAYSAAKGGVIALTRKLAIELGSRKIRVNCYCPSTVDTPMAQGTIFRGDTDGALRAEHRKVFPLGRFGDPTDIANLVLFLASDESSWMTGSVITIDGGLTAQ